MVPDTSNQSLFQNSKLQNLSTAQNNIIHTAEVISIHETLYSRRKWIKCVFFESESCQIKFWNPLIDTTNDKLINQPLCKYAGRVVYLVLLINSKCQWGH